MSVPLSVLIVEDSEDDARLLVRELRRGGYEPTHERVDTAPAMNAALEQQAWDIVVADYSMPGFSALAALSLIRTRGLDVPFIIVSGSIGEETAVEAMRAGAHDYIMKANLARLTPAIERELREAAVRRTRSQAEQALRESEEELRTRARQQAAVAELGQKALSGIGLSTLMGEAVTLTARTLGVEHCNLLEPLPDGSALLLRAGVGWKEGLVGTMLVGAGTDSQAGYTLLVGEPVIVSDLHTETRFETPSLLREHGIVSGVSVVIRGAGRPLGVFGAYTTRRRAFTQDDLHFLQAIAHVLAMAIERRQLEAELRQRADALAEADRRKDEFLAMLAHELRNPLAPIRNAVHLLRLRGGDPAVVERVQNVVERQVRHMTRLTDDLLDVSRITRGKILLRYHRLDLTQLVSDAVEDHRSSFEAAGVALAVERPEEPAWVVGDPVRIAQIVGNLLQNAAKFTDPAGRATVQIAADGDRREARVIVRDTGIGIASEMLPHVFESFTQADRSLDRSRGGLGLGLALVKELVELHGGEVRAESQGLGRGAAFTLLLPLERSLVPSREPSEEASASGPLRILVVEDNSDTAETLRDLLELSGHEVQLALSGPDGLAAAREFRPEVVLCDLGLPGMDGYAVAAALRRDPATASVRLLAVSGYGQDEDRRRAHEAGFDLHLTKPLDFATLQRLLAG